MLDGRTVLCLVGGGRHLLWRSEVALIQRRGACPRSSDAWQYIQPVLRLPSSSPSSATCTALASARSQIGRSGAGALTWLPGYDLTCAGTSVGTTVSCVPEFRRASPQRSTCSEAQQLSKTPKIPTVVPSPHEQARVSARPSRPSASELLPSISTNPPQVPDTPPLQFPRGILPAYRSPQEPQRRPGPFEPGGSVAIGLGRPVGRHVSKGSPSIPKRIR